MKRFAVFSLLGCAWVAACGSADERPDNTSDAGGSGGRRDSGANASSGGESSSSGGASSSSGGGSSSGGSSSGGSSSGGNNDDAGESSSSGGSSSGGNDDAGNETDAGGNNDAAAPGGRPGQCYTNAHCGAGYTCTATAPGGFCLGCGGDVCNVGPADQCNSGSCNESCNVDADCPDGLRCNPTRGACVLRSCSSDAVCGTSHRCSSGFCRRVACPDGQGCPDGTTCRDAAGGKLCIEDALDF